MASTPLQYPIGAYVMPESVGTIARTQAIAAIARLPFHLADALYGLGPADLAEPYRPGGWTLYQVVHHVADSHLNGFLRFKFALTEEQPTIRPYDQEAWARLADAQDADVSVSLSIISGLHARWHRVLTTMTDAEFARTLVHPEVGVMRLDQALTNYAWHGAHHVAHITGHLRRVGRVLTHAPAAAGQ